MCPFLLVDRWSNSKGFNLILLAILNIRSKPVRAHLAGMFIGGEKRSFAASGAGQGGRKICALMTGEVAEPFRWLCSTGCMLKFFHVSTCHASVMCLGGPPWPLRSRNAGKSAACAELWGLIFLCRVKVHTVKGVSMAKLDGGP